MVEQDNSTHRATSSKAQAPCDAEASDGITTAGDVNGGNSKAEIFSTELGTNSAKNTRKKGKERESSSVRVRRERRDKFGSIAKSSLSSGPLELSGVATGGFIGGVSAPMSVTSLVEMEGKAADREQRGAGKTRRALAAISKKKKEALAALKVEAREGTGVVVPLVGLRTGLREGAIPDPHLQPGVGTHRTLSTDHLIASGARTLR